MWLKAVIVTPSNSKKKKKDYYFLIARYAFTFVRRKRFETIPPYGSRKRCQVLEVILLEHYDWHKRTDNRAVRNFDQHLKSETKASIHFMSGHWLLSWLSSVLANICWFRFCLGQRFVSKTGLPPLCRAAKHPTDEYANPPSCRSVDWPTCPTD